MTLKVVVLVGLPGSGKSTLAAALLGHCKWEWPWSVGNERCAIGRYDTAPYGVDAVAPWSPPGVDGLLATSTVMAWLQEAPRSTVVVDNPRFDPAALQGHDVQAYHLDVPQSLASQRRMQRGSRWMPADWWARVAKRTAQQAKALNAKRLDASVTLTELLRFCSV